jgi:hypothetical protein
MKKRWFSILIIISFAFLCVGLYSADYLKIPIIVSPGFLLASFGAAMCGFLLDALAFRALLRHSHQTVPLRRIIAAIGLNSFTKYVPGKMWGVVGAGMYLALRQSSSVSDMSMSFFNANLISLWCGFLIGLIGLFLVSGIALLNGVAVFGMLLLTFVLFTPLFHAPASKIASLVLRRSFVLPQLSVRQTLRVLPRYMATWFAVGVGFYCLAASLVGSGRCAAWLFAYHLAATAGTLTFFAPGGIGVREGALAGYLSHAHMTLSAAVTVATASRLWALVVESLYFVIGFFAEKSAR